MKLKLPWTSKPAKEQPMWFLAWAGLMFTTLAVLEGAVKLGFIIAKEGFWFHGHEMERLEVVAYSALGFTISALGLGLLAVQRTAKRGRKVVA